jgi:hypothetical protein
MSPIGRMCNAGILLLLLLAVQAMGVDLPPQEAADLMAANLDQTQEKEGPQAGWWAREDMYMGPTTAGMVCAYEWIGNAAYQASAELAGGFIQQNSSRLNALLGDEAYALTRLSEISEDPNNNTWRTTLKDFYSAPRKPDSPYGSTALYTEVFSEVEASFAVFYLAHHTLAAFYVDDVDKQVWRHALIKQLSRVDDDNAINPVMALGVATWALAQTGPLDDTPIYYAYVFSSPIWKNVKLSDLPTLLASHQVPSGEPFAGGFYWCFDHSWGAGGTEDAIYGTLGLVAVASLESPQEDLSAAVSAAGAALLGGIDEQGQVYQFLSGDGVTYHTYAGEMLQALWSVEQYNQAVAGAQTVGVASL